MGCERKRNDDEAFRWVRSVSEYYFVRDHDDSALIVHGEFSKSVFALQIEIQAALTPWLFGNLKKVGHKSKYILTFMKDSAET